MEPLPAALDPEVLAETLRRSGQPAALNVRSVSVESDRSTVLSRILRVRVGYDRAAPDVPTSLVYKTGHPDRGARGWPGGRREVAYYADVAPASPGLAPLCYAAEADEAAGTWHLLLEDLSETHATVPDWPLPPAMPVCERIVTLHARHQARHWDAPHLAGLKADWRWRDEAAADAHTALLAERVEGFLARVGDRLPDERRGLFGRLLDAAPRLRRRFFARRHLTVVQGDAHVWNCFLPRDGGEDGRLFDWDSWRVDVGASDLAYMIAMHWYPDLRREREGALLDRFHAELVTAGVGAYERAALAEDYRFAVLWQILWPVTQEAYGIPPVIWWNNLERILLAIDDLGCAELLRS